jgi:hypothetical protein
MTKLHQRKYLLQKLPAILSIALCAFVSAMPPAQAAPGWVMDRQNGLGIEVITASKDGVLIAYPRADFCVVSTAPKWDVTWYSNNSKTRFTKSLARFRVDKGLPAAAPKASQPPKRATKYAGVNAFVERVKPTELASTARLFAPVVGFREPTAAWQDYYYSDPVDLPPQALLFISSFLGTRNYPCFPLASHGVSADGSAHKIWYTKGIKTVDVKPATFDIPKACKTVATQHEVTSGGGYRDAFDDLAVDMKLGQGFGSNAKPLGAAKAPRGSNVNGAGAAGKKP